MRPDCFQRHSGGTLSDPLPCAPNTDSNQKLACTVCARTVDVRNQYFFGCHDNLSISYMFSGFSVVAVHGRGRDRNDFLTDVILRLGVVFCPIFVTETNRGVLWYLSKIYLADVFGSRRPPHWPLILHAHDATAWKTHLCHDKLNWAYGTIFSSLSCRRETRHPAVWTTNCLRVVMGFADACLVEPWCCEGLVLTIPQKLVRAILFAPYHRKTRLSSQNCTVFLVVFRQNYS